MSALSALTRSKLVVRLAGAAVLLTAIAGFYFSPLRAELTLENARLFMNHLQSLWYGPILFVAAFAVGATLVVPATLFVVVAGLVWGWFLGGLYAVAGATMGAFLSFLIARWLGSDLLRRFGRRGEDLADRLQNAGFRSLLILRLIPIFPFAVLNYSAGFAGLRARDFVLATLVGTTPSLFIVAYSADAIVSGTLTGEAAFQRLAIAGVLLAAMVIVPSLLKRRATRALHLEGDS